MFKNFWYAVEFSKDVTTKPKKIICLGQQLVVYRKSDGSVACLSDLCVHRGAALSKGELKGDCLVCPYHGWEYEPNGAVSKIPANPPERSIPKKARVDSYPTIERYGFLWVFLGDLPEEERPPIPVWPEFEQTDKYRAVTGEYLWHSSYERIMENGTDIAHAPFVHGGAFGNPEKAEVPDHVLEEDDWSCFAEVTLHPPAPKGRNRFLTADKTKDLTKRPGVRTRTGWMLPNLIRLEVNLAFGQIVIYDTNIPIDENTTLVKWVALRTFFKGAWADKDAIRRTIRIFDQDKRIVDTVRPELLPFDLSAELQLKSDGVAVAYRRRRQQLIEMGWGIESNTIVGDGPRTTATVIPSPARRENPELNRAWVFKEVQSREITRSGEQIGRLADASIDADSAVVQSEAERAKDADDIALPTDSEESTA